MDFENVQDIYSLAPIQEGMLFHSISEPNSGVGFEQICCTITGNLNVDSLKKSWLNVVHRHEALRTMFLWDGLEEPLQVVREEVTVPWNVWDWRELERKQQQNQLHEFLAQDRQNGFELSSAPLIRMTLIRIGESEYRLIWSCHHLIVDGWSVSIVLNDFFSAYANEIQSITQGKSQNIAHAEGKHFQYKTFIEYLQNQSLDQAETFWRERLAGFESPTKLIDYHSKIDGSCREHSSLPLEATQKLTSFAKINRLTLNTVVLGAWAVLLSRYAKESDVVFGTTVSGRPAELQGVQSAIGLFINTLPMRVQVTDTNLNDWLQTIQQQQIAIRDFEHSPLASVQRWSDLAPNQTLFESIVVFENYPESIGADLSTAGIDVLDFDYREQSNYPLALLVVPGEQIEFFLVHDQSQFSQPFAQQLLSGLTQILNSFADNPQKLVTEHDLLSSGEYQALIVDQDATKKILHVESPIHNLIEAHAKTIPDAQAVVFKDESLTYQQLNERANNLASHLVAKGVETGEPVGLLLHRSLDMIIGILGILKSGAGYVPLDPDYPAKHLQLIADDASLKTIVTSTELRDNAITNVFQVVLVDDLTTIVAGDNNTQRSSSDELAYVIYTSGSQGQPKGVPISHRNIVSSTLARAELYQHPVERFLLLSSFSFDSSMVGIFWTLIDGGTIVLPAPKMEHDLHRLLNLISSQRVTHLLCLPSLYRLILEEQNPERLASLKTAIVAGESCSEDVLRQHFNSDLQNTRLFNEYGPTEATVWCAGCELTKEMISTPIPIGRPIANSQLYILDPNQRPLPPGVAGEIYVGGAGVAKGYLNQQELTESSFVDNPFDSDNGKMYRTGDLAYWNSDDQLVFVGRADNQVKIRGFRIELGEIENAIRDLPHIRDVVVTAKPVGSELDLPLSMQPSVDEADLLSQLLEIEDIDDANKLIDLALQKSGATQ